MLALLFAPAALAQEEVAPTDAPEELVDDASVGPLLENLGTMLEQLEGNGVQVTDLHLGRVKDDGAGVSMSLAPLTGGTAVVAGLGDPRRIVDLDLAVADTHGGRWTDQMTDDYPMVQFDTDGGEFTATVLIAESLPGAPDGFYLLASGFLTDPSQVVSASGMVGMLQLSSSLAESMSLRFVTGGMAVMSAGQNAAIDLTVPADSGGQCLVMAFGDPQRTKKLAIAVTDKSGNVVAAAKGKGLTSAVVATGSGSSRYRVVLTPKLESGYGDAHAMTLVACQ